MSRVQMNMNIDMLPFFMHFLLFFFSRWSHTYVDFSDADKFSCILKANTVTGSQITDGYISNKKKHCKKKLTDSILILYRSKSFGIKRAIQFLRPDWSSCKFSLQFWYTVIQTTNEILRFRGTKLCPRAKIASWNMSCFSLA